MAAPIPESPVHIYAMMARLGIEPDAGVLPRFSLRHATAFRRCEHCRSKKACQNWLDYAPALVNFAPDFCVNADILFELQCDQPGLRLVAIHTSRVMGSEDVMTKPGGVGGLGATQLPAKLLSGKVFAPD